MPGPEGHTRPMPDTPMLASLERVLDAHAPSGDPRELPWGPRGPLRIRRSVPALLSFVDDHGGPFPRELFPPAEMRRTAAAIQARHDADSEPLTVDVQLGEALALTRGRLLAATVLLHAVTRQLARGRDGRACPGLYPTLEDRLQAGTAIAPFAPEISLGSDPLGDTYHYWAMVAAGVHHVLARRDGWIAPGLMLGLFYLGPKLMRLVRQELFGRTLFFGDHLHVDRLGLWHGLSLAHRLRVRGVTDVAIRPM